MAASITEPLLIDIFGEAKQAACEAIVLRNYESLPAQIPGSDIDISVTPQKIRVFSDIVQHAATRHGWHLDSAYPKSYQIVHIRLVKLDDEGQVHCVRFDIMAAIGVGCWQFLSHADLMKEASEQDHFLIPCLAMEFAIILLTACFSGTAVKEKYRIKMSQEPKTLLATEGIMTSVLGPVGLDYARALVADESLSLPHGMSFTCRKKRSLKRPLHTIIDLFRMTAVIGQRVVSPPGRMMVILGPDGIGKSTVTQTLRDKLALWYPQVVIQHLRPSLLPRLGGNSTPNQSSASTKNNKRVRKGMSVSLIRFIYYGLDYILGYWVRLLPRLAKGQLLIFDRYFYDYYYDQNQKGVHLPPWFVRVVTSAYPRPRNILVLTASPEKIRDRRADLGRQEIERQLSELTALPEMLKGVSIIDANGSPEQVAEQVLRALYTPQP